LEILPTPLQKGGRGAEGQRRKEIKMFLIMNKSITTLSELLKKSLVHKSIRAFAGCYILDWCINSL